MSWRKTKWKIKQDGRLAPAYFSPNYNYFGQPLQTVKNETTVLKLIFKSFLQTSIPPLISIFYAKFYHNFILRQSLLTTMRHRAVEAELKQLCSESTVIDYISLKLFWTLKHHASKWMWRNFFFAFWRVSSNKYFKGAYWKDARW